jgi:hypothetical protein
MEPAALLEALVALAGETGLPVRRVGETPAFEGLSPSSSGVCRVRGEVHVLLADSDPLPERIRVLARALSEGRAEELAGRFLPPAVRECLEPASQGPPADP